MHNVNDEVSLCRVWKWLCRWFLIMNQQKLDNTVKIQEKSYRRRISLPEINKTIVLRKAAMFSELQSFGP